MNPSIKQTLYWTPRILGILFVLFISIFAADVFEEHLGFGGQWEPCSYISSLPLHS